MGGLVDGDDKLPAQVTKPHVSGVLSKVRLDPDDRDQIARALRYSDTFEDDYAVLSATFENIPRECPCARAPTCGSGIQS